MINYILQFVPSSRGITVEEIDSDQFRIINKNPSNF